MQGIRRINNKDFSGSVEVKSRDEFEVLANSFNAMAVQLGRQFNALKTMAEIDQLILSRLRIKDILDIALTRMRDVVPCDLISVIMASSDSAATAQIYVTDELSKSTLCVAEIKLAAQEIQTLLDNPKILTLASHESLPIYLKSLAGLGAKSFILFLIILKESLATIICLGYRDLQVVSAEDLSQGRDFADRIAVGFSKAAWERQLYHQAHYDFLTDLPNRMLLNDRLQQVLAQAERRDCSVAILFIDLDRFKAINDSLGHRAGDVLLKKIAERLSWTLAISGLHRSRQAATLRHFLRPKRDVHGSTACRPDDDYSVSR